MSTGRLVLIEGGQKYSFGEPNVEPISVHIRDPKTYKLIFTTGALGAGTAYVKKYWETSQLPDLLCLILENQKMFRGFDGFFSKLKYFKETVTFLLSHNNLFRAEKHIQKHYDLSNQFFELFLDRTMMYSCAVFQNEEQTLEQASHHKLKLICDKLALNAQDHLLEIGTGWGGMAIFAAQHYGCKVTSTTISSNQYHFAKKRVKELGLEKQVTVLKEDYRKLKGQYDKIVSIEMIEAVGFQYFPVYFTKINELLKTNGKLLIQAITINDRDYHRAKFEVDFIKKYIFPGGCLPSLAEIRQQVKKQTRLNELDMEDIGEHYVKTLALWTERFNANIDKILALGFSQEFINKWLYYFAYCQAGFASNHISNVQGLWIKQ